MKKVVIVTILGTILFAIAMFLGSGSNRTGSETETVPYVAWFVMAVIGIAIPWYRYNEPWHDAKDLATDGIALIAVFLVAGFLASESGGQDLTMAGDGWGYSFTLAQSYTYMAVALGVGLIPSSLIYSALALKRKRVR